MISKVFPAHAGVFLRSISGARVVPCLPRACGGISSESVCRTLWLASSPRMRGYFSSRSASMADGSVFPAHAGVFQEEQPTVSKKLRDRWLFVAGGYLYCSSVSVLQFFPYIRGYPDGVSIFVTLIVFLSYVPRKRDLFLGVERSPCYNLEQRIFFLDRELIYDNLDSMYFMNEKNFSLIYDDWISVEGSGYVSLYRVFKDPSLPNISGGALTRISIQKFLQSLVQSTMTPASTQEWMQMGADGMAEKCIEYLDRHRDVFLLYGDRPFLQMPGCITAELRGYESVVPGAAAGNSSFLTHRQLTDIDDGGKVRLLLQQMSLGMGGKKADRTCILTPGYQKRSASPGPAVCSRGLLHTFLLGRTLRETIWLNMLTMEDIAG